ncbi:MAG: GHKL domain-containing protein [Clostridium sp.]
MYFSELKVSLTNQELNQQLESFQTQYEKITSSIEDARKSATICSHLNVIRSMLQENRLEDLDCYLTQYTRSIDEVSQQKYTACPLLDSILNYYAALASAYTIEIDAVVVKAPPIEAIDLTVLLGNALENAIQESELTELADIQIYIRYVDEYLLIRVENECNYKADSGMIVPKKHSQKHSYGMINMRTVCEKYGGNAAFYSRHKIYRKLYPVSLISKSKLPYWQFFLPSGNV